MSERGYGGPFLALREAALTMTLTEFLLARIAEDVAVAKAAAHEGREWKSAPNGYDSGAVEATDGPPNDVGIVVYDEGRPSAEQAAHIARHDPARVLADCEAKRQIVERYKRREGSARTGADFAAAEELRGALWHLALPYADHPDYRPEWKP